MYTITIGFPTYSDLLSILYYIEFNHSITILEWGKDTITLGFTKS